MEYINGIENVVFPKSYIPEDTLVAQLEFALKYDGINLEILKAIFNAIVEVGNITEFRQYILKHPTGKYARKLWFLYEFLLDTQLSIPKVSKGNYIDLLETDKYFTCKTIKSSRHRINNNLLGNRDICPVVRRTSEIKRFLSKRLQNQVKDVVAQYDDDVITRASQYLHIKETKSSFKLDSEQLSQNRTNRLIDVLRRSATTININKEMLIELQNHIVDQRFTESDYRKTQNYVGEKLGGHRENIRYIAPRPEDVESCMEGLFKNIERMKKSHVDFIVQAAVIAFSFLFIRPFEDGNGRLHRFLIHQTLAKTGFLQKDCVIPISSVMLADQRQYNDCLEDFYQKTLLLIDYKFKRNDVLVVKNETADHYRYHDSTRVVEYLFDVIEKTIQENFISELSFVAEYNKTIVDFKNVVDMPDNLIIEFIKASLDNNKKSSKSKHNHFISVLSKVEIIQLEEIIDRNFSGVS